MTSRLPVTPNATAEAVGLLAKLYSLQGHKTLSGQHNTPREMSNYSDQAESVGGAYPAVWGQDFGFAADGTMDGVNFRQGIVDEAKRQHEAGSIITLMWHAVRPTENEPVTFEDSICNGKLSDQDWQDLLTPGTTTHDRWKKQVDVIAGFLAQLREASVPVLWRPYHEMNGEWFWWGTRPGPRGYEALYRQLFERLTEVHGLTNLLWVWNANARRENVAPYSDCYPGHDVVDILAFDVYENMYGQGSYEELVAVAEGRPVALGEVGVMPTPDILETQPLWSWYMTWTNFLTEHNTVDDVRVLMGTDRVMNRGGEDQASDQ